MPTMSADKLLTDPRLQFRVDSAGHTGCANPGRVDRYFELSQDKAIVFDPVAVAKFGREHYVTDGFHTLAVLVRAGKKTVPVVVTECETWADVLTAACRGNRHGEQLDGVSLQARVRAFLSIDDNLDVVSDYAAASVCGVGKSTVARVRQAMKGERQAEAPEVPETDPLAGTSSAGASSPPGLDALTESDAGQNGNGKPADNGRKTRTVNRGGKTYNMDVTDVGKKKGGRKKKAPENPQTPAVDGLGNPIPEVLQDFFGEDFFHDTAIQLSTIIAGLKSNLWNPWAHVPQQVEYLEKAFKLCQVCKPFAVCPSCQGEKCHKCKHSGFVPQASYQGIVEQLELEGVR